MPDVSDPNRRRALAFNAVLPALKAHDQWLPLSVRQAVADAVLVAVDAEPERRQGLRALFERAVAQAARSHPTPEEHVLVPAQPAEHCGDQSPTISGLHFHVPSPTECVLRPDHSGSHAAANGTRWWLHTEEQQPTTAAPRNPAYEAVFAYIRNEPHDFMPRTVVERNAMIWHAVHAALDAAPTSEQQGNPSVQGRCPACGSAGLFLGEGGYVTCPRIGCTEPDATSTLLEQEPKPRPAPATTPDVCDPCPHCGDHQLIPRRRQAEHLARLHPDELHTTET